MLRRALLAMVMLVGCKDTPRRAEPVEPPPAPAPAPTPPAPMQEPSEHTVKTDMPPATEITSLVKANNRFALELWSRLDSGNLAVSPVSISTALAMAWAGAKGETAAEMRAALHFEGPEDRIVSQWARVSYALQDPSRDLTLKMAHRLFGAARYPFDTTYFTITRKAFDAPLDIVDFQADPEAARARINAWVAERTEQRIENLMPPRSVTADTRLVIVNAIYFLAEWAEPFDAIHTREQDFHVAPGRNKRVPTMHRQGRYRLAQGDAAALLELPYRGGSAAMYVLLPDKLDGLAAIERALPDTLKSLQSKLADASVMVSLPKFVIDPQEPLRLAKHLQALGIEQAFDPAKADFTGIAPANDKDRISISEVVHQAFVRVDEKGTEAAAATAVAAPGGGPPPQAIPFEADHPFLFFVVDRGTGLILFVGRVVDPQAP